ncbi:MAG TPA: divalent metal cation transporter [Bryobacteraceae bacterium]|nr:divalent metal cation transporter [Bryobacteraceae bacterium]
MKKLLGLTFGIMTALGGFLDFGQIVFTMQAGALFEYRLLWAVALGTFAIIVYMEMCGRVAVVAHEPVLSVVRTCFGDRWGLVTLIASQLLTVITCAAELGGSAIVLHLLTGWSGKLLTIGVTAMIGASVALLRFQWIERSYGLAGLAMLVFAVAAISLHPDWQAVVRGLGPRLTAGNSVGNSSYYYFAVGIFSAMLMEYEVQFYSSGAIEEDWKVKDLPENFLVAGFGSVLGGLLTVALVIAAATVFAPRGIFPVLLSTTMLPAALPLGEAGLMLALAGTLACLTGAAVETSMSSAYKFCQFFNLPWGKSLPAKKARVFTAIWAGTLAVGALTVVAGARPADARESLGDFRDDADAADLLPDSASGDGRGRDGQACEPQDRYGDGRRGAGADCGSCRRGDSADDRDAVGNAVSPMMISATDQEQRLVSAEI